MSESGFNYKTYLQSTDYFSQIRPLGSSNRPFAIKFCLQF